MKTEIDRLAKEVEAKVIAWRRDIHQHPELSNREFRTGALVARHLKGLGLEVKTDVAKTGVTGLLHGKKKGAVVALRADMDALPVIEMTKASYASKNAGVMHACGHDCHTAILMGTAEVLTKMREKITGSVKFIFQPAEEGPPEGEEGGAFLMIKEGALKDPMPDAIIGLHVGRFPGRVFFYRSGPFMASGDVLNIVVKGSQTHGAMPWQGVDPIVVAAQIVIGLQSIVSRQTDLTRTPAVISIGKISGGQRFNIIPQQVEMMGTIRVADNNIREEILVKVRKTAQMIAKSAGATAKVTVKRAFAVTFNDPALTAKVVPILQKLVSKEDVVEVPLMTSSEDFSFYQEKIPGFFFFMNVKPPNGDVIPIHSPFFDVDEKALITGVRALSHLAVDFLKAKR
ncbi:MAG: amidohydrolase [Smithellaceae bacterium]|nr:amidohydrolase [Smithellaceae bacterium]